MPERELKEIKVEGQYAIGHNDLMPKKLTEKRVITLGIVISEETKQFLKGLAEEDARSVSWVAHELLQRGIAQYRRDGMVREPDGGTVEKGGRKNRAA